MAAILDAAYTVLVLLVAISGLAVLVATTRDLGGDRSNISDVLMVLVVAVFLIALAAGLV